MPQSNNQANGSRELSTDETYDLFDKLMAEREAEEAAKKKKQQDKEKVKDLLKEGAKQGRGGLGGNTQRLLDQIDD